MKAFIVSHVLVVVLFVLAACGGTPGADTPKKYNGPDTQQVFTGPKADALNPAIQVGVTKQPSTIMVKVASSLDKTPCVPLYGEFTIDITHIASTGWVLFEYPLQDPLHYTVTDTVTDPNTGQVKVAVTIRGGGPYWLQPSQPIIVGAEVKAKSPWGTVETFTGPGDYFTYDGTDENGCFRFRVMGGGYATPLSYTPPQ